MVGVKSEDTFGRLPMGRVRLQEITDVDAPDDQYVAVQPNLTCGF
jgi:hypothetical protein